MTKRTDALNWIASEVRRIPPGQSLCVSMRVLGEIAHPPEWTAAEWVLENVVGSAYSISVCEQPSVMAVRFSRRLEPIDSDSGLRTFVSGDRKHLFRHRPDGLYEPLH